MRSFTLPEGGTPRFTCATFTVVTRDDTESASVLCITSANAQFVKFRVTGAGADPGDALQFVESWAPLLTPGT